MKKVSGLYLLIALIAGCGGSGADVPQVSDIQPGFGNDTTENFEANMRFYAPDFVDKSGKVTVTNLSDNSQLIHNVDSLNQFALTVPVSGQYNFMYTPNSNTVTCPILSGCGRSLLNDPNDLNGNNEIDFGEPINAEVHFELVALPVPGINQVLFSSFNSALAASKLDSSIWSLTAAPNNHLTQSTIQSKQKAEYVSDVMTYIDVMHQHNQNKQDSQLFANAIEEGLSGNSAALVPYRQLANDYLIEILITEETNALYRGVSEKVLIEVNELLRVDSSRQLHTEIEPYSNDLMNEVRNAIGVLRLQDEQYSEDLKVKLEEVEELVNDDSQDAFLIALEVIGDVVKHVSPFENSVPGNYTLPGLDINYQTEGGFRWVVTGVRQGFEVNVDISVPEWRISPTLGDKILGLGVGEISKPGTKLKYTFDVFEIVSEGSFDPNNASEVIGVANASGKITLLQGDADLTGDIHVDYLRQNLSIRNTKSILPFLSVDGVLTTPNQVTPLRLYANERSPLALRSDMDLVLGAQLELALNGGKDLRIQVTGEPDDLSNFTTADISLILGDHVSEITVTNLVGNINVIVRGKDGYWVDIKKKKDLYTGGFYFGDKLVADVRTIRGIPGILFPDGSFESLF
ncbi:hypothetical protein [Pseudoalteromonas luteoviolacea]|uniref:Uncharacterized protein n=1 Tax=Pseudoalteromonas luteoviolacea S4054 TaxID=1129367 RepID=A0A0F6ADZ5_9GAMM|nr:hypothetical protein [Pseudoalteromonas luteoviolacea]AOT08017.1 hypothetical protein S4054249_09240 [Pseudoalteromonas luteoviolacea]AOT12934.1 hypothetical protein S40542_09240 [Pseudoalteromonas luteoviolacea]AOT17846.1 hypothetical protein S4054_09235 [Pseudoalteromonas luteoviolacea]KKE84432.1 hypothetical protein N479_09330 [Pseudoalteromonas luteoviolacea S4054]KZN71807.1 hypothetical protein N481_17870 [Pseudoalteromonas luteoviolacea S4047-1]